jgi:hypothetical protein
MIIKREINKVFEFIWFLKRKYKKYFNKTTKNKWDPLNVDINVETC